MTTIQPSLLPLYSMGTTNAISSNQLILDQLDSQPDQNTADNIFGGAYSLNLSDDALNMLSGNGSDSDSAANILGAFTYPGYSNNSPYSDNINALLSSFDNGSFAPPTVQYSAGPMTPTAMDGSSFEEAALADGGPLPAFLAYVDQAMNLNPTQQQSLDNIATAFENAPGSQQTVDSIATALQQAGIPETI